MYGVCVRFVEFGDSFSAYFADIRFPSILTYTTVINCILLGSGLVTSCLAFRQCLSVSVYFKISTWETLNVATDVWINCDVKAILEGNGAVTIATVLQERSAR